MTRFFVTEDNINPPFISLSKDDSYHLINVLRFKVDDEISVSDSTTEFICKIHSIENEHVIAKVFEAKECETELKTKITIFQGLPKLDKMELIIQKNVELGVHSIVPVTTEFAIAKTNDKTSKKVERWNKISEAAAKQSKRGYIPQVFEPIKLKEAIEKSKDFDLALVAYEKESTKKLKEIIRGNTYNSICVFIGPEGGFSEKEIEEMETGGIIPITLGKRILRTETASICITSQIVYEME